MRDGTLHRVRIRASAKVARKLIQRLLVALRPRLGDIIARGDFDEAGVVGVNAPMGTELCLDSLRHLIGADANEKTFDDDGLFGIFKNLPFEFIDMGLLTDEGETIRLTREGVFVSDAIWPEML